MKNILKIAVLALSCITFAVAQNKKQDGIFAEFNTSKGKIVVELEYKKTPITVANFISLAEGKNPKANAKFKGKPFYDGLKFHRVIADFMIQGGCPDGTGASGPGYKFDDEIVADLKHSGKGILSMANAGPATNGSQFFITHKATPHLDGKHTVFGHVISGQEVVDKIVKDDVITSVKIIRSGKEAKKFNAEKVFANYFINKEAADKLAAEKQKEAKDADVVGNRIRQNNKLVKKYLSEAKKQMGDKVPFYMAMEKALHNFLKAKLHIETVEMSKDNIIELLQQRNASEESISQFMELMNDCEFARYAPATDIAMTNDFERAVERISELEKQLK